MNREDVAIDVTIENVELLRNRVAELEHPEQAEDAQGERDEDGDTIINRLRLSGLSIDGDNAYKRDLLDCVVGALAFGFQGRPAPDESHWLLRFWEIGNAEREARAALAQPSPAPELTSFQPWEAENIAFVLRNIGALEAEDIDGDNIDLRFEDANGRDTGCDVSIVEYAEKAADLLEQHDRVVQHWRQKFFAECDNGLQLAASLACAMQERDAAQARVAELSSELESYRIALIDARSKAPVAQAGQVPDIDAMVSRFLGWKLPQDFYPDCGISFDGRKDDEWNKNKTWPVGTNLFTAVQAKAMFEHALAAAPAQGGDGIDHAWCDGVCDD